MSPDDPKNSTRLDYQIILDLIEPESRVIDLGCGDGELLSLLKERKSCHGTGIEIDEKAVYQCVAKGVTVSHGDINTALGDYSDKRFDYVILNESLQQVPDPKMIIDEALRVGKKVVVGIPNFCHIAARVQLFFKGRVPVTKQLPYEWFNTPNLRFFSIKDFQYFCILQKIKILALHGLGPNRIVRFWPNLFAYSAVALLER